MITQTPQTPVPALDKLPTTEVIRQLVVAVGEFLTVVLSNATDTDDHAAWEKGSSPAVRAWLAGEATPPDLDRLRFALEIVRRLSVDHGNAQIHAWFGTVHPAFGEMPARVIGRRPLSEIRGPILRALPH